MKHIWNEEALSHYMGTQGMTVRSGLVKAPKSRVREELQPCYVYRDLGGSSLTLVGVLPPMGKRRRK